MCAMSGLCALNPREKQQEQSVLGRQVYLESVGSSTSAPDEKFIRKMFGVGLGGPQYTFDIRGVNNKSVPMKRSKSDGPLREKQKESV